MLPREMQVSKFSTGTDLSGMLLYLIFVFACHSSLPFFISQLHPSPLQSYPLNSGQNIMFLI